MHASRAHYISTLGKKSSMAIMSLVCTSRHRVSTLNVWKSLTTSAEETSRRRLFTLNGPRVSTQSAPIRRQLAHDRVAAIAGGLRPNRSVQCPIMPQPARFSHQSASMEHRAFIALGSNLGDRVAMIEQACKEMDRTGNIRVLRTSSLWETKAMYVLDQDKFVNGVCEVTKPYSHVTGPAS